MSNKPTTRRRQRRLSNKRDSRSHFQVDEQPQGSVVAISSRVHPKKKGGSDGNAVWIGVNPAQIEVDCRQGMPRRFLIPKYRLPQKKYQDILQQALSAVVSVEEAKQLVDKKDECKKGDPYQESFPSRFALVLTQEETNYLLEDLTNPDMQRRCVEACFNQNACGRITQVEAEGAKATNELVEFLRGLPKNERDRIKTLFRRLRACFEVLETVLPRELAKAALGWTENIVERCLQRVPLAAREQGVKRKREHSESSHTEPTRRHKKRTQTPTTTPTTTPPSPSSTSADAANEPIGWGIDMSPQCAFDFDSFSGDSSCSDSASPEQSPFLEVLDDEFMVDDFSTELYAISSAMQMTHQEEALFEPSINEPSDIENQELLPAGSESPVRSADLRNYPVLRFMDFSLQEDALSEEERSESSIESACRILDVPTECTKDNQTLCEHLHRSWEQAIQTDLTKAAESLEGGQQLPCGVATLLLQSVRLLSADTYFPMLDSIQVSLQDHFRDDNTGRYFERHGWDKNWPFLYMVVSDSEEKHYTGLFVIRDSLQSKLLVLVCDSLFSQSRQPNDRETETLNKLRGFLHRQTAKLHSVEFLKDIAMLPVSPMGDSSCGIHATFIYPLLLQKLVASMSLRLSPGQGLFDVLPCGLTSAFVNVRLCISTRVLRSAFAEALQNKDSEEAVLLDTIQAMGTALVKN